MTPSPHPRPGRLPTRPGAPSPVRHLLRLVFPLALGAALVGSACTGLRAPGAAGAERGGPPPQGTGTRPSFYLIVVVDQLRADDLTRFRDRFLPPVRADGRPGGFRALTARGAWFPAARFDVMNTMTCAGHAALATGAFPRLNGSPLNYWWDRARGEEVGCMFDPEHRLLGVPPSPWALSTSPRPLGGTTFSDELKLAGHPSRVVSVAIKDRAAITLGGHLADLALWFDRLNGAYVTSDHYRPDGTLPGWVQALNEAHAARSGEPVAWEVDHPGSGLSAVGPEGPFTFETTVGGKGYHRLPGHLDLVLDAARGALENGLVGTAGAAAGERRGPDLLAVSFAAVDYMGHMRGHNHRYLEELLVEADRAVADLLALVDEHAPGGLADTVVVLTSDHGSAPEPSFAAGLGLPAAAVDQPALIAGLEAGLVERHGERCGGPWIEHNIGLHVYLDRAVVQACGLTVDEVAAGVAPELAASTGVFTAITAADVRARRLPPGIVGEQILASYVEGKSGDVVGLWRPFHLDSTYPVTHVTGWSYDRTIPLILAGPHVRPGIYTGEPSLVDVAPTLSFLAGVAPPALSEGRVLGEILDTAGLPR